MTTYNPNVPQGTDNLSVSQGQILGNFSQLNTQFAVDHVAFNTGSGNGNGHHKKVTFDNAPVSPTLSGTQSAIYPQLLNSAQNMVWGNASNATQITGPYSLAAQGYAFLPGGLLIKWANVSFNAGNGTISFPTGSGIPVFSGIYTVFIQNTGNNLTNEFSYVSGISTTGFNYYSTQRTANVAQSGAGYYLAIGAA